VISSAQLRGKEKGRPVYDMDEIVGEIRGHAVVLTGCRKGAVRRALAERGPEAAFVRAGDPGGPVRPGGVMVELIDHQLPEDSMRNEVLAELAAALGVATVATNAVHYATPRQGRLAAAMAAVRARRSLDEMAGWLPPAPAAFIRTGAEMQDRFHRFPGAVQRAAVLGVDAAFDLKLVAPDLPPFPVPDGHDEVSYLRHLTFEGAAAATAPARPTRRHIGNWSTNWRSSLS